MKVYKNYRFSLCLTLLAALATSLIGCRIPVVDRARNIVDGVPVLGSSICCPEEDYPATGTRFGKLDLLRYGPQPIPCKNPCSLVASWSDDVDCSGRQSVLERLVGKRRLNHCLPVLPRNLLRPSLNGFYSEPRDGRYDQQVLETAILYLTLNKKITIDGLRASPNDVLAYNGNGYAMLFDGDDVGLENVKIDAFAMVDEFSFLFSFAEDFEIDAEHALPGLHGKIDASDLVLFHANHLGPITRGVFQLIFDGSDVGLKADSENVDAVDVLANGTLLISTTGKVSVSGFSGSDKDVLAFLPESLGSETKGSWQLFLKTKDLKLNSEFSDKIDAMSVISMNEVLLSFDDSFRTESHMGIPSDIVRVARTNLDNKTNNNNRLIGFFFEPDDKISRANITAFDVPNWIPKQ